MVINNFINFLTTSNWITKLVAVILLWITPALELLLLLLAVVALDYILDVWNIYKYSKGDIRDEIWAQTKRFGVKLIYYTILSILLNGLQVHLIGADFDLYRWFMAVPILGESVGVIATIEKKTGIKLIDSFKDLVKNIFKRGE